ncbi:MAG: Holliday junction resolvase-like protein [Actinomycetota bacterium]
MSDQLLFVLGFVLGIVLAVVLLRRAIEARFKSVWERGARDDALARSRATLKGKIGEQLAPVLPGFGFQPSDARFLGNPVDFVVFDGYTTAKENTGEEVDRVVFLEVKQGTGSLSTAQRRVRDCILDGRVEWEELRLD